MPQGFAPDRLSRIGEILKTRYVDSGALPGVLTLVWRRGALAHQSQSGVIDLERGMPMRADAIFRIYSMTKPVTSVALLMLLEEGKIALDDPVHLYIPGFARLGVFAGGNLENGFLGAPAARPMKVIDLMRHTSGLTYDFLARTNLDAAYMKLGVAQPKTEGGLAAMIAQLELLPLEQHDGHGQLLEQKLGQRRQDGQRILGTRFRRIAQRHARRNEPRDERHRQRRKEEVPDSILAQQQQGRQRQHNTHGQRPDPRAQKIEKISGHGSPIRSSPS